MRTLSPAEFQALAASGAVVLDVRLPEELAIAALPGAVVNIPLNDLPDRIGDLNPNEPIAVLCHHGVRSERAARFLERSGFSDVSHLGGGIDAWSQQIDESVPRY
jgi:rhodanese-related sulfurtransferase